jgi:hypothetical protein
MPRRPRPGEWAVIYAEVPPELKGKLLAMANRSRRSLTAELTVALESYTANEPPPAEQKRKPRTR